MIRKTRTQSERTTNRLGVIRNTNFRTTIKHGTRKSGISEILGYTVGVPRFFEMGREIQTSTEGCGSGNSARRNYPFNLEMLQLADLGLGKLEARTVSNRAAYAALTVGFFSLLRVSEMENMRMRDVKLDRLKGCMYMDVFLTGSKTDQYNQGGRNRLMAIG